MDRLHEETGHPVDVCYTLVEEYRRYMYLVGSTGETLAPSPIVDLVWGLHVADERAYFDDFCQRVIGRTIYRPEGAPLAEFVLQDDPDYIKTLEYYAQEFGRPQVQFWPDPDFTSERISSALFWIISLAAFGLAFLFSATIFAVFGAIVIATTLFLRWKYSSLPLRNLNQGTDAE